MLIRLTGYLNAKIYYLSPTFANQKHPHVIVQSYWSPTHTLLITQHYILFSVCYNIYNLSQAAVSLVLYIYILFTHPKHLQSVVIHSAATCSAQDQFAQFNNVT